MSFRCGFVGKTYSEPLDLTPEGRFVDAEFASGRSSAPVVATKCVLLKDTPIIVVSAIAGRELAVHKPVAVFDKPIDPDKFIEAVEKALGGVCEEVS